MQSWGAECNIATRKTNIFPTRSGIIGLLANALGMDRGESLDIFEPLKIGVRADKPGKIMNDFQTLHWVNGKSGNKSPDITDRKFLEEALFLVGIQGDDSIVECLHTALQNPKRLLYLGRKRCVPEFPLVLSLEDKPLLEALSTYPVMYDVPNYIKNISLYMEDGTFNPKEYPIWLKYRLKDVPKSFLYRGGYGYRNVNLLKIPIPLESRKKI